jgi:hypothetical protein
MGQMRDEYPFGELTAYAIDEARHRKKEDCSGDGDRRQPDGRHAPIAPTGHCFLPDATAYR